MKRFPHYLSALLLLLLSIPSLQAATLTGPLVKADWLMAQTDTDLIVIDIQAPKQFAGHHIAGAVNIPFSQWRTGSKGRPPSSLVPLEQLAGQLGKQGISASTPVIIVATGNGPGDLSASARVYWSLQVLGHEQAAILDGGLISYVNDYRGAYVSGPAEPAKPIHYQAKPRLELLADADWVKASNMPRLDARSEAEYIGLFSGGRGERPGTIPGAHNLSYDWLSADSNGRLRPVPQLQALFKYAGLQDQAAVHFCHTGNRASLTWFVDYALLGHKDARLYDGSMLEWARDPTLPIERKLKLPPAAAGR
jgi:thiosulfate/3-mercaptopyruvate sulfurtransferase